MRSALAIALGAILLAACGPGAGPFPAGAPWRPKPKKVKPSIAEAVAEPPDCAKQEPDKGPDFKPYRDRVIDLGQNLADQGLKLLHESEEKARPVNDRNNKLQSAVDKFLEALAADPYNIRATYNLAAAYARIGRRQCSLNLLARMAEMHSFPSQKDALTEVTDRLFGRGKKWQGRPDPDFEDLRSDQAFLNIVKELD
jgi:hypothetical protein